MASLICSVCGITVSDEYERCPECGNLLNVSKNNYTYLGKKIKIKKSVDIYIELQQKLKKMASDGRNNLKSHEFLMGKNHLEDVAKTVLTPIKNGVDLAVKSLNKLGFDITETDFFIEEEESFSAILYVLENFENKYSELIQEIAGKEAYRNFRQSMRGRFVGGGYGIDGMIKGALTSVVANAVVGAGYSIANIIGNVGTRIKVDKKALELSENIRNQILQVKLIEITLKNIELSFLKKCSEYDAENYLQEYDTNHNNYHTKPLDINISDRKERLRIYLIILESLPYCPIIYKNLLLDYGDEKGELAKLAKKYKIDINRIKKEIKIN